MRPIRPRGQVPDPDATPPGALPFLWVVLASLVGCSEVSGPPAPEIVDVRVEAGGPLVQTLVVELDRPRSVVVSYGRAGAAVLRVSSESAARHRILLPRLVGDASYDYTVRVGTAAATGTFRTGALPEDLASISLAADGEPTSPLTMLEVEQRPGFRGLVVVDADGRPVWFYRTEGSLHGSTRRPNGNFVLVDTEAGLLEVTADGRVVARLPQEPDGRTLHHDVRATEDDEILFLANDRRPAEGGLVAGEAVWRWIPETGETRMLWTSWSQLSPSVDRGPRFRPGDWLHANSISLGPRGNLVVSLHFLNQVVSVAPGGESLEWRLGGTNATVSLPAEDRFSGQHTATELEPGRILIFDNGLERAEPFSRAVEFRIEGTSARKVWEFRPDPDNWSRAVGSAWRLPNGNTFVTFGLSQGVAESTGPVEVFEVDSAGEERWHLTIGNVYLVYRATPLGELAGESVSPRAP